ncbi:hypothetical protein CEE69_23330 [Rhodopirellula bahusiensis]|uniref:Uncharacterized protein n=1 Tax=Rhodopirellula bahusiensis TaxID=2014065 RepID=A0A2G1W1S2_9BACT|nr:hypothetical protein CEE69_23330 [Rhodopirellula bahusiensis]
MALFSEDSLAASTCKSGSYVIQLVVDGCMIENRNAIKNFGLPDRIDAAVLDAAEGESLSR